MSGTPRYSASVFVNCPFDDKYRSTFRAVVFSIFDCGFDARCALEFDDGSEIRLEKIYRLIESCKFAVHDLSRTELDSTNGLPRFNMPLELGIFLGAKRFGGGQQKQKVALVLDRERYRYQEFISDIAGQDIHTHDGKSDRAAAIVRDWLSDSSGRKRIPGGDFIIERYVEFQKVLPEMCRKLKQEPSKLTFSDFTNIVAEWLKLNAS